MYRYSGVLVRIRPALRRHEVVLAGFSGVDVAVLEDYGGVSEYEVDGSRYIGFSVELTLGEGVQGVLVTDNGASKDDGSVRSYSEGDRLVLLRAGVVNKCNIPANEAVAHHT